MLKLTGIDSEQTLATSSELLRMHQQHKLQVQTLIVGVAGEAATVKPLLPVSAAFFRYGARVVVWSPV